MLQGRASISRGSRADERGIALALALFAMVVVGGLVGSSFFAARLEQHSGQNTIFVAQVREAAELGLSEAMASLTAAALGTQQVGEAPMKLDTIRLENGLSVSPEVTRLTSTLFLVRARAVRQAAAGRLLASRSLGLLVRLPPAPAPEDGPQMVERGWVQLY